MEERRVVPLLEYFRGIADPRIERKKKYPLAEWFAETVREHWGIENSLHYILDVALKEDACRIRKGSSPENMSFIRKIALTIARSDKETKSSVTGRIKQMAWSEEYLEKLLFNSDFAS
jgi:hypothetical protein